MIRTNRLHSRYSRILGISLGISLAAHAAVLGLGRLNMSWGDPSDSVLKVVNLEEKETPEERAPEASEAAQASLASVVPLGLFDLIEKQFATPIVHPAVDYTAVLALATTASLQAPIIPQPRIEAAAVESGLTPIRVLEPIRLATASNNRGRSGGGGIGIGLHHGGKCPAGPRIFPGHRIRVRR